ncbi:MAG TPA: nuclear transport factor 2 family protein [Acidobacteriota bacterium]
MKKILFALLVLCISMISYSGFAADAMLDKLSANEKSLWEAIKNGDMKTFSAGVSDEIMDIDVTGVMYNKQQLIENLSKLKMSDYSLSDFQLFNVDKDTVVLSYISNSTATMDSKTMTMKNRNSTTYTNHGGKWMPKFHTETAIMEQPAM